MPTYEYQCPECGHIQEEIHGMKEKPKIICEECYPKAKDGDKVPFMQRLISGGGGVIFKGEGFHCNDYSKDERKRKGLK